MAAVPAAYLNRRRQACRYKGLARVTAMDIALKVRDGGALAGDHPLDQIADRDDTDNFVAIDHGQMSNAFVGHEMQAFFDRLTPMRDGQIG